ncbi:hypothetical protein Tcan_16642 [Toxocara canis]|uniref:Uncharacterized protein n=1 Tax=Toxocara canis TaxID=6265 RepID=A0A0B2VSQ0_TOXCA|nr:hypothetical protein Tcan_16642 [Toxocara canis]
MRTSKTTSQYPSNAYGVPISSDSNTNYFFDYDAGTVREKQPNWPRHARRAPNNETRSADDSMTFDVSAAQWSLNSSSKFSTGLHFCTAEDVCHCTVAHSALPLTSALHFPRDLVAAQVTQMLHPHFLHGAACGTRDTAPEALWMEMIVFSRDETERQPTVVDAFGECRIVQMPAIVFAIALFALFMLSTALLCLQKRFYEKRLLKCSFSPNFEMLRVKNF